MAQLKMYWFPGTSYWRGDLPEGFSFSKYNGSKEDRQAWFDICLNGLGNPSEDVEEKFAREITTWPDINPTEDVNFLDYKGYHVGTITAFVYKEENVGDVHMVAIRSEYRGMGLAKYLSMVALDSLVARKVKFVSLTTSEGRIPAVKSYLAAGFLPVEYEYGMERRWEKVLEMFDMESIQMVYNDGTPYKTIYRASKAQHQVVRVGVVGAGRGRTMMNYCKSVDDAKLVAICDNSPVAIENAQRDYGADGDIAFYTDYDKFLQHDLDLVVLANYANAHAPFAVKALKAGKHVLSEVLPVQCMKEAVELVEAVESTGKIYAYAENYCFMAAPKKIRNERILGHLGTFEYGEGEYMHNCEPGWAGLTHGGDPEHWRNTMSAFFYCTHSLGPLIHIAGQRPVSVVGFEGPFNKRMERMGAKAGPYGLEIVTLESGAILKSLHGVGPSKNSIWYSVYGSLGRYESSREDASCDIADKSRGGVNTLYANMDKYEGENHWNPRLKENEDALTDQATASGHGGSDYYIMYNMIEAIKGNGNHDIIDVYEALDMFLPGLFAYRSARAGNVSMDIPNLRDKAERDKWRNDTECTDPAVAGDMLIPSYSKGNPEIPAENYAKHKATVDQRRADEVKRHEDEDAAKARVEEARAAVAAHKAKK